MKRKVTCYFVVQLANGSILPPEKRVLTVKNNCVTTSFDGLPCQFIVPDTGKRFVYEVSSPQLLSTTRALVTSRQLHTLMDTSFIDAFARSTGLASWTRRIFGRKASYKFEPTRLILEKTEQYGVVEGDFIIFSRKLWEELKTK